MASRIWSTKPDGITQTLMFKQQYAGTLYVSPELAKKIVTVLNANKVGGRHD